MSKQAGRWENGRWVGARPSVSELLGDDDNECQCCRSIGVPLKVFENETLSRGFNSARSNNEPPFKVLCGLCAGTMASVWDEYPDQHRGNETEMMKAMCFIGNAIIKAVGMKGGEG